MRRGVAVVGVALLLAGGVAIPFTFSEIFLPAAQAAEAEAAPAKDRAALEQRAKEYWQARLKGDLDRAYAYEDPVRQKTLSKEAYRKNIDSALKWQKADVLKADILPGGELADITIDVQYQAPIVDKMITVTNQKKDTWQKLDGTWYHVLDLLPLPTGKRPIISGTKPKGA